VLPTQGLVPLLLQRIAQIFPVSTIYTPFDQVSSITLQPPACNIPHEPLTPVCCDPDGRAALLDRRHGLHMYLAAFPSASSHRWLALLTDVHKPRWTNPA